MTPPDPARARPPDRPFAGIAFKLGATLWFAAMAAAIKALGEGYPVGQIVFFRSLFALIPVLAWAAAQGSLAGAWTTNSIWAHVWRSGFGIAAMFLSFVALQGLPLADWTAISFGMPIFATVFAALLFAERVGAWRWSAVAAGFAGILIMVGPKLELDARWPALIMLASTLCSGLVINIIRRISATESGLSIVFYFMLACTAVSAATLPFAWRTPDLPGLGLLTLSGLLGGLGQIFNTFAYTRAQPSLLGPFDYVAMIWAVGFGVLLFDEWPDAYVWAGAVLVIASGLVIAWRERARGLQKARAQSV